MRHAMKHLRAGTILAAALVGTAGFAYAEDVTLTVWDWKSGDPTTAPYFDKVKADFEAAHPGVTVKYVMQPHDQYYTLLGTALSAKQGPDLVMVHGGAPAKERTDALVKLDDAVAPIKGDIAGWAEFTGNDGGLYAIPLSIQGFVIYYNKDLYTKAGLDPENPPKTWAEVKAMAEALKEAGITPFSLGNKEGFGADFFLSSVLANGLTPDQAAAWEKGELKWSSPEVKAVVQAWVDTAKDGWYADGANSTAKFMDEYESFERGENANTIGLISDVAHWKEFGEFLGDDKVGAFIMPPLAGGDGTLKMPFAGGIGYGVTRFSPHQDLAIDLAKSFASPEHMQVFFETAGAIPSSTKVDTSKVASPSAKAVLGWLGAGPAIVAHNSLPTSVDEEWHRQSQLLLTGETTVDQAVARLDDAMAQAEKK